MRASGWWGLGRGCMLHYCNGKHERGGVDVCACTVLQTDGRAELQMGCWALGVVGECICVRMATHCWESWVSKISNALEDASLLHSVCCQPVSACNCIRV